MLGLVDIPDSIRETLHRELDELRTGLVSDPYFKNVPSMEPRAKKTALPFTPRTICPRCAAKCSPCCCGTTCAFSLSCGISASCWRVRHAAQRGRVPYRYHPNELYDSLVRRLFKTLLHKDDEYRITFAKRGAADRTAALREDWRLAPRFTAQWNIVSRARIEAPPRTPPDRLDCRLPTTFYGRCSVCMSGGKTAMYSIFGRRFGWCTMLMIRGPRGMQYYIHQKKPLSLAALESARDIGFSNLS